MGTTRRPLHRRQRTPIPRRKRILPIRTSSLPPSSYSLPLTHQSQVNRNKKSVGLSFNNPSGIKLLHSLVQKCDVLVENYLPNSLKKYSLDYATLSRLNPSLIYASVTGYGQTGPYSDRAGYDVMVEAEMGLMHITGERDGPPVKVGVAVTDLTTGMYTAIGVLAALYSRRETGRGQWIDASLSDCQVAGLANIASSGLISGKKDSGRWGTAHGEHALKCFSCSFSFFSALFFRKGKCRDCIRCKRENFQRYGRDLAP